MRNRNNQLNVRLTEHEAKALRRNSKKAGLTQSGYLRMLLSGYAPQALPPVKYHRLISQLSELHTTLQASGRETDAAKLRNTLLALQETLAAPQAIDEGNGA